MRIILFDYSEGSSKQFSWKDSILYAFKNFTWRADKKESKDSGKGKSAWKRYWEFFQSKRPKYVKMKNRFQENPPTER